MPAEKKHKFDSMRKLWKQIKGDSTKNQVKSLIGKIGELERRIEQLENRRV